MKRNRKTAESTKKLCRYVTKLEQVVGLAVAGALPEDTYPWVRQPPAKGSVPVYDAQNLSAAVASKAAHGEVVNRYTAEALASTGGVQAGDRGGKAAGKRRVKGSRFAKDGGADGADGAAAGAGGGPGGAKAGGSHAASGSGSGGGGGDPADPFTRALEPPKPRLYMAGGRILVFVVGGVTQLEIAALDRLSHSANREVVVGGTSLLTARDFLEQLLECEPGEDDDEGGGGFAAVPGMEDF
jgi:hypothetical protein